MYRLAVCFILLCTFCRAEIFNSFEDFFSASLTPVSLSIDENSRLDELFYEFVKSTDKDQQASLITRLNLFRPEKLEIFYEKKLEQHFKAAPLSEEALRSLGLLARVTMPCDSALDILMRIYFETKADVSKSIFKFKAAEIGVALSRYSAKVGLPGLRVAGIFQKYKNDIPKPLHWTRLANGNVTFINLFQTLSQNLNSVSEEKKLEFLRVFIEKYQNFPPDQLITCKEGAHVNIYSAAREMLFNQKEETLREFLLLHFQDGKNALQKARKSKEFLALAQFSGKYFYSIPGLKALLEFSSQLAKNKQLLLALALVEEGMETIEKLGAANSKYLDLRQPYALLGKELYEAFGERTKALEIKQKISEFTPVVSSPKLFVENSVSLVAQAQLLIDFLSEKSLKSSWALAFTLQSKKIPTILARNKYPLSYKKIISLLRLEKYVFRDQCNAFSSDLSLLFDAMVGSSTVSVFTEFASSGDMNTALKTISKSWVDAAQIRMLLFRKSQPTKEMQKAIASSGSLGLKAYIEELETLDSSDPKTRDDFLSIVAGFGSGAKKEMLKLLLSENDVSREIASYYFVSYPSSEANPFLIKNLSHKNHRINLPTCEALVASKLRPEDLVALFNVLEGTESKDLANQIIYILYGKISTERILLPVELKNKFLEIFKTKSEKIDVRGIALEILSELNIDLEPIFGLIEKYGEKSDSIFGATKCLVKMGSKGIYLIKKNLASTDVKIKTSYIYAFHNILIEPKLIIEDILRISLDKKEDAIARAYAIQLLSLFPSRDLKTKEEVLKAISQTLDDDKQRIQIAALGSVYTLRGLAMPLLPKIVKFFEQEDPLYSVSIEAFSRLGKESFDSLLPLLKKNNPKVKIAATRSLRNQNWLTEPKKVFEILKLNWKNGDDNIQYESLVTMHALSHYDKIFSAELMSCCDEGLKHSNKKIVDYCKMLDKQRPKN
jgi:hypothetical protein